MPITLAGERFANAATQSSPYTFSPSSNCLAGNLLLVLVGGGGATAGTASISDSAGNFWNTSIISSGAYTGARATIRWSVLTSSITTAHTITVTMSSGTVRCVMLEEFTFGAFVKDGENSASDSGHTTFANYNTGVNSNYPDCVVALAWEINATGRTFTPPSGHSTFTSSGTGSGKQLFGSYRIKTTSWDGSSLGSDAMAASYSGGGVDNDLVFATWSSPPPAVTRAPVGPAIDFADPGMMTKKFDGFKKRGRIFVPDKTIWRPKPQIVTV